MIESAALNALSADELAELSARAARLAERKKSANADDVRRKLIALAKEDGFDAYALFGSGPAKRIGQKLTPKYRELGGGTRTWVGRGKPPQWFRVAIDSGVTREQMLIPLGSA